MAVALDAIAFVDSAELVLDIISILETLIPEYDGFMPHCCLYSTIEMMQDDAKIATNNTQNDIRTARRNCRHHGSSINIYSSSNVNPTNLKCSITLEKYA